MDRIMQGLAAGLINDHLERIDNSAFPGVAADAAASAALRDRARALLVTQLDKVFPPFFHP